MVVTPVSPPSPALPTSTSLDHELTLEAPPDTRLDETPTPGPNTPEKEKESDCVTEERPSTSSPVQFIGINYVPPDVQTTSQPRPPDPTPWDSGAASLLSEDYVVIGLPTFPPKPCVVFPVSFDTQPPPTLSTHARAQQQASEAWWRASFVVPLWGAGTLGVFGATYGEDWSTSPARDCSRGTGLHWWRDCAIFICVSHGVGGARKRSCPLPCHASC